MLTQSDGDDLGAEDALGEHEGEAGASQSPPRLRLARSVLSLSQIWDSLIAVVVLIAIIAFAQLPFAPEFLKSNLAIICLLYAASAIADVLVVTPFTHRRYSLQVFPDRLIIRQGWIFQQVVTIPRRSVLNLRHRRGPVLRRLDLTTVSLLTIVGDQRVGILDPGQVQLIEGFVNGEALDVLT